MRLVVRQAAIVALLVSAVPAQGASPSSRPRVVVVAHEDGAETTDFLVPYGILAMSDAVELSAVSTRKGRVPLHPALTIELDETLDSFDASHPEGADYVVVPAQHRRDDPALVAWLKRQADRGAVLVAICDGVWTAAATGALDGKRATGHWYSLDDLESQYPGTTWVRDRRWVRDGAVLTTTGVTASIPASLGLVEEVAGAAHARALAGRVGVEDWSPRHDSADYVLSARDVVTAAGNWLAVWRWEDVGIPVTAATDEIRLALAADALSRTYRSSAVALAESAAPLRLRHGITLVPDGDSNTAPVDRVETLPDLDLPPAASLDRALASIEKEYGGATADFVALQIESPERGDAKRHARSP